MTSTIAAEGCGPKRFALDPFDFLGCRRRVAVPRNVSGAILRLAPLILCAVAPTRTPVPFGSARIASRRKRCEFLRVFFQVKQLPIVKFRFVKVHQFVALGDYPVMTRDVVLSRDARNSDNRNSSANPPVFGPSTTARGCGPAFRRARANRPHPERSRRNRDCETRCFVHAAGLITRGPADQAAAQPILRKSNACRTSRVRPKKSLGRRNRPQWCSRAIPAFVEIVRATDPRCRRPERMQPR